MSYHALLVLFFRFVVGIVYERVAFVKGGQRLCKGIYSLDKFRKGVCRVVGKLTAVFVVHLVAVVLRGVVAGGDVYAHVGAVAAHHIGQVGRGHALPRYIHLYAVFRQNGCRHLGKLLRIVAGIVGDGAACFAQTAHIRRHSLRGAADGVDVHSVCARPHYAAQSRRAEGQIAAESLLQLLVAVYCRKAFYHLLVGGVLLPIRIFLFVVVHKPSSLCETILPFARVAKLSATGLCPCSRMWI